MNPVSNVPFLSFCADIYNTSVKNCGFSLPHVLQEYDDLRTDIYCLLWQLDVMELIGLP